MAVSAPAAGSQVHFHIAAARRILAYLDHRVAKIRTALKIMESGVKHAHRLTIQGLELIAPQSLMKPNGLKQPFGRGIELLAQQRRHATTDAPLGVKAGWHWRHRGSGCAAAPQQSQYKTKSQVFLTKSLPGNCRMSRFISRLRSATDTAELGRPLLRITSSILTSSWSNVP